MLSWVKEFFTSVFGSFWSSITMVFMRVLAGPAAFFLFGPIFDLSGYLAEFIMERVVVNLGSDFGVNFELHGAWIVDCLRLQECISIYMSFLCLGFTLSLIRKIV